MSAVTFGAGPGGRADVTFRWPFLEQLWSNLRRARNLQFSWPIISPRPQSQNRGLGRMLNVAVRLAVGATPEFECGQLQRPVASRGNAPWQVEVLGSRPAAPSGEAGSRHDAPGDSGGHGGCVQARRAMRVDPRWWPCCTSNGCRTARTAAKSML